MPSPTVEPATTARPKAKARPSRWSRAATTTGVVELIYDQASTAVELVRAREGLYSVRGTELSEMGLETHEAVGHYVRRTIGESVAVHPHRGDPLPPDYENVDEYFHVAKGVFGGDFRGTFLSRSWSGFDPFDSDDEISDREYHYLNKLMYDFNSLLRHKIGRFAYSVSWRGSRTFPTLECDEGAWVSVDTLLERDQFWIPTFAQTSARGNPSEKCRRLRLLMKANWAVGQKTLRYRLQFLGVKVCPLPGNVASGDPWSNQPVSIDVQIAENQAMRDCSYEDTSLYTEDDSWIRPWAVRATSGHSVDRHSVIRLDPTKIAYHPTLQVASELGGGFHATSIRNIYSIIDEGILPGGPHGSRLSTHFGVFAPWDPCNITTRYRVPGDYRMPLLVLYVPSYVLLNYGATLSDNGVYLVSRPIPFEQVRDAWIAVPQQGHRWQFREVRKILSESLENEIVENINGTYDPNGTYLDATPAKVKEILLSLNPGPHAAERDQLVEALDTGDRSYNLKRRCVAMCSRHYISTTTRASQRCAARGTRPIRQGVRTGAGCRGPCP